MKKIKDIFELSKILYENQDNKVKFHNKKSDINNNNIEHSEFQRIDNVEDFNDILSKEEIISKLGRKYKKNLVSIAKLLKHINYNQNCLSQTILAKSLGCSQNKVSKIIKKLVDIKVLRVIDNSYSYIEHTSKVYQVNQNMISIIKNIIKEETNKEIINKNKEEDNNSSNTIGKPIRFSVSQRCNLDLSYTDDQINDGLCNYYPFLREQQDKAERLNQTLPDELKIKFYPTVKRSSKHITKIGLRATNSIVSLKNRDTGKDTDRKYRKEYYDEYFGKDEKLYKYDFKASVYRLTYFLNNGVFPDKDYDLYTAFVGKKMTKDERDYIKRLSMLCYFTSSTKKIISNNREILKDYDSEQIKDLLDTYKERMLSIIGKFYQSEIFVYESSIYLDIYEHLLKNHNKVTQIYDEFVSNEDIREEIEKYIKDNLNSIKEKYNINTIGAPIRFLPEITTFEMTDNLKIENEINKQSKNTIKMIKENKYIKFQNQEKKITMIKSSAAFDDKTFFDDNTFKPIPTKIETIEERKIRKEKEQQKYKADMQKLNDMISDIFKTTETKSKQTFNCTEEELDELIDDMI